MNSGKFLEPLYCLCVSNNCGEVGDLLLDHDERQDQEQREERRAEDVFSRVRSARRSEARLFARKGESPLPLESCPCLEQRASDLSLIPSVW